MRFLTSHRGVEPDALPPWMTPATAARLEAEGRAILEGAAAMGVRWGTRVLHIEPDAVRLRSRAELADELRAAGVRTLAKVIELRPVRPGEVLVFVDGEGRTGVTALALADVLGGAS